MPSHKKAVILDFDGTMADTVPLIRAIYDDLAKKNNWKPVTDEDYARLRKGTLWGAVRWAGVPAWKLPIIFGSARRLVELEAEKVKIFPGMAELVSELNKNHTDVYVLSRNLSSTIARVLNRYEIEDKASILTRRKRFLGSKAAAIRKLIRTEKYDKKYVWMVGDEIRDIQAAKKAGVKSVAVTWGIQDISILQRYKPDYTANSVQDLRKILQTKV